MFHSVATALTVYGIETDVLHNKYNTVFDKLQQLLPFTVLKLKYFCCQCVHCFRGSVATALTVYGIETLN